MFISGDTSGLGMERPGTSRQLMAAAARRADDNRPPFSGGGKFKVTAEIGELLDLRCHDGDFGYVLFAGIFRAPGVPPGEQSLAIAAARDLSPNDLPLADQLRGELGSPSVFARGAAQDEGIAAVFDDSLRRCGTVGPRDLCDRLKTQHASAAELAKPGECILEPLHRPERAEFFDHDPQPLIALRIAVHGLKDCYPHPTVDHPA